MRIWHKDLIPVLPEKQLRGQWRECCAIAKAVRDGNLNHVLVNKVKNYSPEHLYSYGVIVGKEMEERGINVNPEVFLRYFYDYGILKELPYDEIFHDWHDERYLKQCYYNLQEKYDCGAFSTSDMRLIMIHLLRRYENKDLEWI